MVKINIKLSNRWLYTILAVVIIILAGVSVYALELGGEGDPGHNINSIAPPADCTDGESLKWNGQTNLWVCVPDFGIREPSPSCTLNQVLKWDTTTTEWICGGDDPGFTPPSCTTGEIMEKSSTAWICGDDDVGTGGGSLWTDAGSYAIYYDVAGEPTVSIGTSTSSDHALHVVGTLDDAYALYVENDVGVSPAGAAYFEGDVDVRGGLHIDSTDTTKPTCDGNTAGTIWYERGGIREDDTLQICLCWGSSINPCEWEYILTSRTQAPYNFWYCCDQPV